MHFNGNYDKLLLNNLLHGIIFQVKYGIHLVYVSENVGVS